VLPIGAWIAAAGPPLGSGDVGATWGGVLGVAAESLRCWVVDHRGD
jgi:hypothetical protein